jgi:hypothetical protein
MADEGVEIRKRQWRTPRVIESEFEQTEANPGVGADGNPGAGTSQSAFS